MYWQLETLSIHICGEKSDKKKDKATAKSFFLVGRAGGLLPTLPLESVGKSNSGKFFRQLPECVL